MTTTLYGATEKQIKTHNESVSKQKLVTQLILHEYDYTSIAPCSVGGWIKETVRIAKFSSFALLPLVTYNTITQNS